MNCYEIFYAELLLNVVYMFLYRVDPRSVEVFNETYLPIVKSIVGSLSSWIIGIS